MKDIFIAVIKQFKLSIIDGTYHHYLIADKGKPTTVKRTSAYIPGPVTLVTISPSGSAGRVLEKKVIPGTLIDDREINTVYNAIITLDMSLFNSNSVQREVK